MPSCNTSIKEIKEFVSANQVRNLEQKIEDKLVCIKQEIETLNQKYFEGEQFLQRLKEGAQILHLYHSCDKIIFNFALYFFQRRSL